MGCLLTYVTIVENFMGNIEYAHTSKLVKGSCDSQPKTSRF